MEEFPSWLRRVLADGLFLIMVLGVIQTSRTGMLDDPGLGWHLRNIDAMWDQGGWLRLDPFSGPGEGKAWLANQWLGDLLYWGGDWLGGMEGIAAVTTLVLAFTFRGLFCMLLADGVAWPAAVGWTFLAAMGTRWSWVARPNIFTLLFLLWTARLCDEYHRGACTRRKMLWLLPLFTVWANTHAGFVAGLITLGATTLIEGALFIGALRPETRQAAGTRCRFLLLLDAAVFLCTLINPYGYYIYPWNFQLLGDKFFMNLHEEWLSPDFHTGGAWLFEILILLFPAVLAVSRRKLEAVGVGLAIVWLHFAFSAYRFVALYALVVVPLLARYSLAIPWLRVQLGRVKISGDLRPLLFAAPRIGHYTGSIVISIGLLAWAHWTDGYSHHGPKVACQALNRLLREDHARRATTFHDYGWGGYLIWHGWPNIKTWIDDRNEIYSREHIEDYFAISRAEDGWERKLKQQDIKFVCIPIGIPLARRLAENKGWREIHRDDRAVIFQAVDSGK